MSQTEGNNRGAIALPPWARIFWLIVSAIYLAWSLIGNAWGASWVIWAIAAPIFTAIMVITGAWGGRKRGS